MNKRIATLAVVAIATGSLASASMAQAHVTVHPNALPSGGFTTIAVRVPNERPKAATTKVDVSFPAGFYFVSYKALPGWKTRVIYRKIAKPVTVFGEKITQEVDRVVWTGKLPAGQYTEFPLSVAIPGNKPGTVLTFKALQTYANGEVVRWIGPPSADMPAPQVVVTGANRPVEDYPGGVDAINKAGQAAFAPQSLSAIAGLNQA